MILALFISLIPFVPGPILLWSLAVITALLDDFNHITIPAIFLITILMIAGSTLDYWFKSLGMRSQGVSCWGIIGSFAGGILGTLLMPVLGTLAGAVLGALMVEFMRLGEIQKAITAGKAAFTTFLLGLLVELAISVAIFAIFVASILLTA